MELDSCYLTEEWISNKPGKLFFVVSSLDFLLKISQKRTSYFFATSLCIRIQSSFSSSILGFLDILAFLIEFLVKYTYFCSFTRIYLRVLTLYIEFLGIFYLFLGFLDIFVLFLEFSLILALFLEYSSILPIFHGMLVILALFI